MDIQLQDNVKIGNFLQYTQYHLVYPMENQETCGGGKDFWCSDWWTIEVAKCLYIGEDRYLSEPIPRRLSDNNSFSQQDTIKAVNLKKRSLSCLSELKDVSSSLFIPQIGRGIDLLLANLIKSWKNIYCFDMVDYQKYLEECFHENTIHFKAVPESAYTLNNIEEKSIAIVNNKLIKDKPMQSLLQHDKIVKIIHMGEIFEVS